jgi:hypothetical protein
VRLLEPSDPRDRGGELQNAAIVDLVEHRESADLPALTRVY